MAPRPELPAKNEQGEDRFVGFTRRLVSVPHDEIKAALDAEKEHKRTSKNVSGDSAASSKKR